MIRGPKSRQRVTQEQDVKKNEMVTDRLGRAEMMAGDCHGIGVLLEKANQGVIGNDCVGIITIEVSKATSEALVEH